MIRPSSGTGRRGWSATSASLAAWSKHPLSAALAAAATAPAPWAWAEVGYQETRSSGLLQSELEASGFTIERGVAGIPTAFVAEYGSGGPVILSTHPASPQRLALVSRANAEIRRQQAAGQTPRPGRAR